MTQSIEGLRLRVVAENAAPTPETLATQIYQTYVAPPSEPEDATALPEGIPEAPQELLRAVGQGTSPPAPPIVAAPAAAVTDEEAALLQETLRGKLDNSEIQALLALMRGTETTGAATTTARSPLSPLPARTVNRYRLGAFVILVMLLGMGSSVLLNHPQGKGLVLPNAPTDDATAIASPTATPSVAPTPIPQLDATLTSRNVALDAALKESEQQMTAIDLTRRDYLLAQADAEVKKNGTPVEVWLIRRLGAQMLELRRAVGRGGQFSGQAKPIGTARALVGDARAVLLALQTEWQTPNAAAGRNRVAPAILTQQMNELAELARVVREASYEQQLRNEERTQQPERGVAPGGKSVQRDQQSQREGHNGVLPSP
jgi:hypothetical protein